MYELDDKFDSLDRLDKWDELTGGLIKDRVAKETADGSGEDAFGFLDKKQGDLLKAVIDVLIPQMDGTARVKIAGAIDKELTLKKTGVKYGDLPWRGDFYKDGLDKLSVFFDKNGIGDLSGASAVRSLLDKLLLENTDSYLDHFLRQILKDAVVIYYSNPLSWNKIGFPGPAFPEGYAYLGCGEADVWEPKYTKK